MDCILDIKIWIWIVYLDIKIWIWIVYLNNKIWIWIVYLDNKIWIWLLKLKSQQSRTQMNGNPNPLKLKPKKNIKLSKDVIHIYRPIQKREKDDVKKTANALKTSTKRCQIITNLRNQYITVKMKCCFFYGQIIQDSFLDK